MHERLWEAVNKDKVRCLIHKGYVKSFPCFITKDIGNGKENCNRLPVDGHHLMHSKGRGIALKESDEWQVSVCRHHHREITDAADEIDVWQKYDIQYDDVVARAIELAMTSPSKKIRIAMQEWRLKNVEQ